MCNFLKTGNKLNGFNRICLSVGHHEALHSQLWEEWRNKLIFQEFDIKFPSLSGWAWEREGKRLDYSAQMNVKGLYAMETYSHIVNMWIRPFSHSQQKYQYMSIKWLNAAAPLHSLPVWTLSLYYCERGYDERLLRYSMLLTDSRICTCTLVCKKL